MTKSSRASGDEQSDGGFMRRLIFGAMLTATLLWSVASSAQERPTLQVLIEDLDQEAAACGIDQRSLESIAALTLRNNGIQVVASTIPYLYVQLTVIAIRNTANNVIGCANNVMITVRALGPAPLGRFKPRKWVGTNLCMSSAVISGPVSDFSKRTNDMLEQHIKICLGELDY